jgi:hypothetical protein
MATPCRVGIDGGEKGGYRDGEEGTSYGVLYVHNYFPKNCNKYNKYTLSDFTDYEYSVFRYNISYMKQIFFICNLGFQLLILSLYRLSSLFVKEEGYKLEGVLRDQAYEAIKVVPSFMLFSSLYTP